MTRTPILLALLLGAAPSALAEKPVLIELFASQNCNACPKAHKTLKAVEAEHRDDVLVLTWSVDYWDYLGTPDPMATPAASDRQAAYAERLGIRAPYTPQSVYDGTKQCPATRKAAVDANIDDRMDARSEARVQIRPVDGGFSLDGQSRQPADVRLVEYLSGAGNTTDMVNPVTRTEVLGRWTGGHVTYEYSCELACAVVIQKAGHGEVYAASKLP